jgi:aminopeptidase N
MTDQIAALACLSDHESEERKTAIQEFYEQWKDEPLVVLKWLTLQVGCDDAPRVLRFPLMHCI